MLKNVRCAVIAALVCLACDRGSVASAPAPGGVASAADAGRGNQPDAGSEAADGGAVVSADAGLDTSADAGMDTSADAGAAESADAGTTADAGFADAGADGSWTLDGTPGSGNGGGAAQQMGFGGVPPVVTLHPTGASGCDGVMPSTIPEPRTVKGMGYAGISAADNAGEVATAFGIFSASSERLGAPFSLWPAWAPVGFIGVTNQGLERIASDGHVAWSTADRFLADRLPRENLLVDDAGNASWLAGDGWRWVLSRAEPDGTLLKPLTLMATGAPSVGSVTWDRQGGVFAVVGSTGYRVSAANELVATVALPRPGLVARALLDGTIVFGDFGAFAYALAPSALVVALPPSWLAGAPSFNFGLLPHAAGYSFPDDAVNPHGFVLFARDGTNCGEVRAEGVDAPAFGLLGLYGLSSSEMPDGTLLAPSPAGLCDALGCSAAVYVWPQLFDASLNQAGPQPQTPSLPFIEAPPAVTIERASPEPGSCAGLLPTAVPASWSAPDSSRNFHTHFGDPLGEADPLRLVARDGGALLLVKTVLWRKSDQEGSSWAISLDAQRIDPTGQLLSATNLGTFEGTCWMGHCQGGEALRAGFAADGRALLVLITDGHASLMRWLAKDGMPLSDWIRGPLAWDADISDLTLFGLPDGGVALRTAGTLRGVLYADQGSMLLPLPEWLASRPRSTIAVLPSGNGVALAPLGFEQVSACTQSVEIFGNDGQRCGAIDFTADSGPCALRGMSIERDGTVLRDDVLELGNGGYSRERRWPNLLR